MYDNYYLIIGILIIISVLVKEKKEDNFLIRFIKKYRIILLIIMFIMALFLYTYKLDLVPIGLNVDEAGMAYDAYSMAHYGVDRFLYKNPVYFINYGDGQNALYTYITSLLLRVFDYKLLTIRIPAVIFGLLTLLFGYKLIKENKDDITAIITLFVMLITPFFIMKSRWALESYLFLPMLIISLYFFMNATKTSKNIYYFLAGSLLGITLYTYAISYVVIFVFVIVSILYLLIQKKITIKNIISFSIPLFILALPLILLLLINNNIIPNEIKTNIISIPKLLNYRGGDLSFANIKYNLSNYHILTVMFKDDGCSWNSISNYGTLYSISSLLVVFGLVISLSNLIKNKKEYIIDLPIFIIFITMFLLSLCISNVNINKINCIYLPITYYIALALSYIYRKSCSIGIVITCLYLGLFISFTKYYFNDFDNEIKDRIHFVSQDFYKAYEFAKEKSQDVKIINIDEKNIVQPYIYILLKEKTNPYEFNKNMTIKGNKILKYNNYNFYIEDMNNREIYITKYKYDIGMKCKRFGAYNVYYLDTNIFF